MRQRSDWPIIIAILGALLVLVISCAHTDRAMLYTEAGVRAAEMEWDMHFYRTMAACADEHPAGTPGAVACFGGTYSGDKKARSAVQAVVGLLRSYWAARAAGANPRWAETAVQVAKIVGDLPPDVRQYFERVQGV